MGEWITYSHDRVMSVQQGRDMLLSEEQSLESGVWKAQVQLL